MKPYQAIVGVLLAGSAFLVHAEAHRLQRDPIALELANKGHEQRGTPAQIILDTVNYSNTTVGAPTWQRPLSDCSGLSGVGVGVGYHVQEFSVSASGAYDITSVQAGDGFMFLYENNFDPTDQLTNCVAGSDDGGGGIGTSDILGETLTAGTNYFVVTTAYEPGEESTFTNTISGGGTVVLAAPGPDLGVTVTAPDGVLTGGEFTYELTATNNGIGGATGVVVTDLLSPSVTFVGATCGATHAAGTVTWNIGALAEGATVTCTVTVSMGAVCATVNNVASIDGAGSDPVASNNSSSVSNSPGNVIADPSFEDGTPSIEWAETSTNFGTPLCDLDGCGDGTGTGPRTGDWWAWFGGIAAPETASVSQSLTIPTGANTLTFWVEYPICSNTTDFLALEIDGTEIWRETGAAPRCNALGYQQVSVDVTAYANDGTHSIEFTSTISGSPSGSNFFLDDLELLGAPSCGQAQAPLEPQVPVPAFGRTGIVVLGLLLGLFGIVATRRNLA